MSGTGGDGRRFDPRFDPAFQPGYDPRNDPAIAARTTGVAGSRAPISPPAPLPLAPEASEAPLRGRRRSEQVDEFEPDPRLETEAGADAASDRRGVNPFLIAMWALSLVLLVAGIVLYRSLPGLESALQSVTADGSTGVSYMQLFATGAISAALIAVGIVTAAGALALHATRWRGRPAAPPSEE